MSLQLSTVADSISKLSVTGLTILDIDEIPTTADQRASYLMPLPAYITDMEMERDSYGAGDAKMTVTYTLNYRLLYQPAGAGRSNTIDQVSGLVGMVGKIWDAVLAINTLTGAVDIYPQGINNMGLVNDPSDVNWFGADIALRVIEFVN